MFWIKSFTELKGSTFLLSYRKVLMVWKLSNMPFDYLYQKQKQPFNCNWMQLPCLLYNKWSLRRYFLGLVSFGGPLLLGCVDNLEIISLVWRVVTLGTWISAVRWSKRPEETSLIHANQGWCSLLRSCFRRCDAKINN